MAGGDESVIFVSDDEDTGPSNEEKQKMISEFVDVTKTNELTARPHLLDSNWNVKVFLNF